MTSTIKYCELQSLKGIVYERTLNNHAAYTCNMALIGQAVLENIFENKIKIICIFMATDVGAENQSGSNVYTNI